MKSLLRIAVAALALSAVTAGAQIVTKMSGIQPLDHPSSYAEKYFAEQLAIRAPTPDRARYKSRRTP